MLQMSSLNDYPMTYRSIPNEYDLSSYMLPEKRALSGLLSDALKEF